jgi:hypothetical protein
MQGCQRRHLLRRPLRHLRAICDTAMEIKQVDRLSRRIAASASRRGLLAGLTSGLLAGFSGRAPNRAVAEIRKPFVGGRCKPGGRKCPNGSSCQRKRCRCLPGGTVCGESNTKKAACWDLLNSPSHCGSCEKNCLAIADSTCQGGRCCTVDGGGCAGTCGPGAWCGHCCSGTCRVDGTCGPIAICVPSGDACPGGCTPGASCPGCCDRTCNLTGDCASDGCVLYGGVCADTTQCCDRVPCTLGRCRYP